MTRYVLCVCVLLAGILAAVNSAKILDILDGSVTGADIANSSLTGADIANSSLTGADILDNSIGQADIAAGGVASSEALDNSLTSADLATNSVNVSEIAGGAVGTSEVLDNSLSEDLNNSLSDVDLAPVQVTATEPAEHYLGTEFDAFDAAEAFGPDAEALDARGAGAAAESWEALASAALYEPDDELRGAAIQDVGLLRHADVAAVLVEVAASDPEPDNRLQAVESLWYSAADGLDGDGTIRAALQAALDDPDEYVATLAERAIEDLEALEDLEISQ